jgi:hypothetical protein
MKYTNIQTYLSDNEFPYRRLNKSDADIKKMFMKLKKKKFNDRILVKYYKIHNIKINTNNLTFLGMPRILLSLDSDYTEFNILSDMFQEKNRLKCKFFSADMSPYDYYKKNAKTLASETLNKYGYIDNINIRDELYFKLKECSSFKPLNLIYLIKLFNVKSVLDPCSGWGDRLIASMACDIR